MESIYDFNFIWFLIVSSIFIFIAVKESKDIKSPLDYFHSPEIKKNIFSLIAANVTLGTGVIYYFTSGQNYGLLIFISPLMVFLGYLLLASLLKQITDISIFQKGNFLIGAQIKINELSKKNDNKFILYSTYSLLLTFILLLAFEIFASSELFSSILFKEVTIEKKAFISILIFVLALFYTLWGGIKAVFKTDMIQFVGIVIFIILIYISLFSTNNIEITFSKSLQFGSFKIWWAAIVAGIASLTTQFYNILNWGYLSHVDVKNQSKLLFIVGIVTSVIIIVFLSIGSFSQILDPNQNLTSSLFSFFIVENVGYYILCALLIFGITSIIFSTIDSLVITVSMFFYDNIKRKNSRDNSNSPQEIKIIRKYSLLSFSLAFIFLIYFFYLDPNIFYLIISIVSGVIVYAPMIFAVVYLSRNVNRLLVFNNKISTIYFILFLSAFVAGLISNIIYPPLSANIGIIAFFLSSLFTFYIIFKSRIYI